MDRSFWTTIRGKLLSRTLVAVLFPVLITGAVAVAALGSLSSTTDRSVAQARTSLSDDVIGSRVAGVSEQIAREIAIFLDERLADAEGWSTDAGLVDAAKAAAVQARNLGLVDVDIETAESQFQDEPRLGNSQVEADLANAVANTPAFKEIFITDINGFNVDYSNPTSDFVQSDEGWWNRAMQQGLDISEPEFDASAGVFAVDISIRLEENGEPVGVLKAALDIDVIQVITDRFVGTADAFNVSIVEPAGRYLAETATAHDSSHIMNATWLATDPQVASELVGQVFAPDPATLHPDGFAITNQTVGGFAHVDTELAELRGDMASGLSAFEWTVVVEQPNQVAFASLAPLEGLAGDVDSTSSKLRILLVLIALVSVLGAGYLTLVFGRRLTSPIAILRDAAVQAAEVTLPNVVSQIDELEPGEELPEMEPVVLTTGDEVEDLARSFNSVQQTAADLASQQARMRRKNVSTTFVNLGRRNQNLLSRQLEHINSMEVTETDADTLQRLFQLDHLATRMRRNAESLLVLAGEETPRRFRQPVSMHQLLQAAGGEVEDFSRIELAVIDDALVEGGAASDIAHLLAELLENASTFSPPGTSIQVHGRKRESGYRLAIIDQGIGMEEHAMAESNARLADPAEFDRAPSAYLGHFVVGHLAKRHGIEVGLTDSPYGGVAAQVHIPAALLRHHAAVEAPEPVVAERVESTPAPQPAPTPEPAPTLAAEPQPQLQPTPTPAATLEEAMTYDPQAFDGPIPPAPEELIEAPVPAAVEVAPVAPAPEVAPVDTTASGFRRRRPGHEGAPQPREVAERPVEPAPAVQPRSPETVRSSLQAFRQGVEAGRAESTNHAGDAQ